MSIFYNRETIQDLIEKEPPKPIKLKRHVSIFKEQVKTENDSKRRPKSTMGNAEEPLPFPGQFLKKKSRSDVKKETDEPRCIHEERKPKIPSPAAPRKQKTKQFLKSNIREVSSAPSKYREKKIVDSHTGKPVPLTRPKYIFKKDFGVAPPKKQLQKRIDFTEEESTSCQNPMHLISHEERTQIMEGLEKNLKQRNAEFLLIPVIIDTPYLINRKKKLENEIKQLEKDLLLITSNFDIYITDDDT